MVDYYGTPTPIQQVANVSVPEAAYDPDPAMGEDMVKAIEKAIMILIWESIRQMMEHAIRLVFPELTEERRKELGKGC